MSLKDKDIDKLYSASAEGLSFEYNESYWDEFDSQLSSAQEADATSLSDSEIDSMYAASSASLAFDYKPDYWDEFSPSLPDVAPTEAALSDVEIDSMYAASSASLAFDYKPDYWNEFNASLPDAAPTEAALSDTEIDSLYAASTAGLAFDYKGDYWKDFNESFTGDAVLSDAGIDEMYQDSSNDLSFDYQPSYWEEFKSRLRRKRRPDFLWFATAYSFVGVMGVMLFMNESYVKEPDQFVAESNKVQKSNTTDAASQSNKLDEPKKNNNSANNNESNLGDHSKLTPFNIEKSQNGNQKVVAGGAEIIPGGIAVVVNPVNPALVSGDPTLVDSKDPNVRPNEPVDPRDVVVVIPENSENNNSKTEDPTQRKEDSQLAQEEERVELPHLPVEEMKLGALDKSLLAASPFNLPKRPFLVGYVQGLGGLSQSLITPSDKSSYSYGLGLGMELHHKNFTYTLGVNGILENHNDLVLNRTAKVYGFGSDVYRFNIDYQQMYTLEGYLGVGYSIGRHIINLGVRPSFVLSTKVRIEEIGSSTSVFATDNNYDDSRSVFGFMDGIHRFGVKPTIGYSFSVTPSISLGGTIGVELMQSINEDFVNGMNNRLPIDGQIYIRKTFSFRR